MYIKVLQLDRHKRLKINNLIEFSAPLIDQNVTFVEGLTCGSGKAFK